MTSQLYKYETKPGEFLIKSHLSEDQEEHLMKLQRSATLCSNFSLYAKNITTKDITYIASGTCSHKCCFICNWHRQKSLRRKFLKWFSENQELLKIKDKGKTKIITKAQYQEKFPGDTAEILTPVTYDLMHCTLTVPHYPDSGFRGNKYYYSEIIEMFNWMRKDPEWLRQVYGGEFGVETERKESGMHIHIHALLFVKRDIQNRNKLHLYILKKWNSLSVNPDSQRTGFTQEQREKIKAGNSLIDDQYISRLNPKGATVIGLETIYSLDPTGKKVRSSEWGSDSMVKAVLETISYHFEPHAFNKDEEKINIPLLAELLPRVYRKILYKKFGVLHGEKALNISSNPEPDELVANLREAAEMLVDEETGEIINERSYFVVNPAYVFHLKDDDNRIVLSNKAKRMMKPLPAEDSAMAVRMMGEMITNQFKKN